MRNREYDGQDRQVERSTDKTRRQQNQDEQREDWYQEPVTRSTWQQETQERNGEWQEIQNKKRKIEKKQLGVISDSTFRSIMLDESLQYQFIKRGWQNNVPTWSGWKTRDIVEEIMDNQPELLHQADVYILSFSGNDIDNRRKEDINVEEVVKEILHYTKKLIRGLTKENKTVVVVGPNLRKMSPKLHDRFYYANSKLREACKEEGASFIDLAQRMKRDAEEENISIQEYIERETIDDNVHLRKEWVISLIKEIAHQNKIDFEYEKNMRVRDLVLSHLVPDTCTKCGGRRHRGDICPEPGRCDRCGHTNHVRSTCRRNFSMCRYCGMSGHDFQDCIFKK